MRRGEMVPYPMPGHEEASSPLAGRLASLGPLGRIPLAPGAAASVAVLLVAWALAALGGAALLGLVVALLFACGFWAIGHASWEWDEKKPGEVVIDEAAGQALALVPLAVITGAPGPLWIVAAFTLFRALILARPWPLGRLRSVRPRAVGLLADDLAAGLATGLALAAIAQLPG